MAFRKKVRHQIPFNAGQDHDDPVAGHQGRDVVVRRDLCLGHHDRTLLCRNPGGLGHDLIRLHLAHAFHATVSCVLPTPCASPLRDRSDHHAHCLCLGNYSRFSRALRGLVSCVLRLPFSSRCRRSVVGCETGMNLLIAGHDGNPFRLSLPLHAIVSRALPMPCAYLLRGRCVHDHCPGPGNSFQRVRGPRGLSSCVLRLPFSSQYQRSVAGCESGMNLSIEGFWTENYVMVTKNF